MSKNNEFKENKEIINSLNIESKLDKVNIIEQLPISSTVKINNPSEEIKITIDNITNVGEDKKEILPEVVVEINASEPVIEEVKINVISKEKTGNTIQDLKNEFLKSEPVKKLENMVDELRKDFENISIVDVSKKKFEKMSNSGNPIKEVFEKAVSMSPVSVDYIEDKAFDSLIKLGGGFIAVTSLASKTFAGVSEKIINK
ncbi:MAG: hypothetical protein U0354_10460 [Candidatus Sericytochromatia bacterium]